MLALAVIQPVTSGTEAWDTTNCANRPGIPTQMGIMA